MINKKFRKKVLIVGGGPAGIFSALNLASLADVLIIDKGKNYFERQHTQASDLSAGIGGAGLFSDGKLCLDLRVGGYLTQFLTSSQREELEMKIERTFLEVMPQLKGSISKGEVTGCYLDVANSKLQSKSYKVYSIGTDRGTALIEGLISRVQSSGVSIQSNTSLLDVKAVMGGFEASLSTDSGTMKIKADYIVLAMGKVGSTQQRQICESLGIKSIANPMNVGVRFETDAELLSEFFYSNPDPKIKLNLPDGNYVKTHCASNNGEVVAVEYGDNVLAGGHQFHELKTGRSGFSLVWNGMRSHQVSSQPDDAQLLLDAVYKHVGKRLAVQRVVDFMRHRETRAEQLADIQLSCKKVVPVNLWDVLPKQVCEPIADMVSELNILNNAMMDNSSVLYAPVIEWWMSTISTADASMQTAVENLYVAGDGSGWSQGIVHAAATGVLAGEAIAEKIRNSLGSKINHKGKCH